MAPTRPDSPLWLSHHRPEHHDRCVSLGGVAVCRRCAVLYPLVVAVAALVAAVEPQPAVALAAMWLAPLPLSIEWIAEQFGILLHRPRRLVATTALASVGIGAALAWHLRTPFDPDVLAPMATHFTICGASSVVALRRDREARQRTELQAHDRREAERDRALRLLWVESGREASRAE